MFNIYAKISNFLFLWIKIVLIIATTTAIQINRHCRLKDKVFGLIFNTYLNIVRITFYWRKFSHTLRKYIIIYIFQIIDYSLEYLAKWAINLKLYRAEKVKSVEQWFLKECTVVLSQITSCLQMKTVHYFGEIQLPEWQCWESPSSPRNGTEFAKQTRNSG